MYKRQLLDDHSRFSLCLQACEGERLELDHDQVLAAGDTLNDLSMLSASFHLSLIHI